MEFEFATANRIIFGPGTIQKVVPLSADMGKCACVVTGRTAERVEPLLREFDKQGLEYIIVNVVEEPTTDAAKTGVELARRAKSDFVVSIGGGSVVDTGKIIAAMMTNTGELEDYLEVIGAGNPLTRNSAPHIAIPTTAGTGAEVTRNSVLRVPAYKVKVSMRSHFMLPRVAVVDPELTYSMPPSVTAATGLDALTQLIEVYVSNKANPLTDGVCREGIKQAGRSLRRAYENGNDKPAREDMALAGLFGGLGLANAKLGAVHGFAGPLGGILSAGHGSICARLLPFVMEVNVKAMQNRPTGPEIILRYDEIAQLLTGKTTAKAADGVAWVQDLCTAMKVQPLNELGLTERDFPTVIEKAQKSSSMKGNPIKLMDSELREILKKSCDQTK